MIAHNGKPITIAMRNRKPINLIARNGKAMFGELEDLSRAGIDAAAKAAIIAEYGDVVWQDTKAYAKAHPAIVPFINQDPHLACSISPNSNKERWLVGDGKAWILLPITFDATNGNQLQMEAKVKTYSTTGWRVHGKGSGNCRYFGMNDKTVFAYGNTSDIVTNVSAAPYLGKELIYSLDFVAKKYEVEHGGTNIVDLSFNPTSVSGTHNLSLYAWQNGGKLGEVNKSDIAFARYGFDNEQVAHYVPHLTADGQCGMLDLVSATFHPNANTEGQFTIQVTDKQ